MYASVLNLSWSYEPLLMFIPGWLTSCSSWCLPYWLQTQCLSFINGKNHPSCSKILWGTVLRMLNLKWQRKEEVKIFEYLKGPRVKCWVKLCWGCWTRSGMVRTVTTAEWVEEASVNTTHVVFIVNLLTIYLRLVQLNIMAPFHQTESTIDVGAAKCQIIWPEWEFFVTENSFQ